TRRPTICYRDWSSDVCSSDLKADDRGHVLRPQLALAEPLVALAQVAREGDRPVAVHPAVESLNLIERRSHLCPTHRRVSQEVNEIGRASCKERREVLEVEATM